MLSASMSSSANAQGNSAPALALSPAPATAIEPATNVTTANSSLATRSAAELSSATPALVGDEFADQLSDTQIDAEQSATELAVPEITDEQAAAPANNPAEPSAEEWLLAMLDQQQLQLQARDTLVPIAPVAIQTTATTADLAAATAPVAASVLAKWAGVPTSAPWANVTVMDQGQVNPAAVKDVVVDKTLESKGQSTTYSAPVDAPANSAASIKSSIDSTIAESKNSAVLTQAVAATSNTAAANAASALTSPTPELNNSQLFATPALTTVGNESAVRNLPAQLAAHTPEAKLGEQLLHTLRDNVQVQLQQKIQNATIRLDPPELGSLEIFVSHESGRLTVHITASQADVARLIQHTSERLRQELAGPQFTQVNVQTSAEGQSGQQQSRERQRFLADETILANEQPAVSQPQASRSGDVLVTV